MKEQDTALVTVKGIAERVLRDRGMTLDRLELARGPRGAVVRIFVDKKEGGVGVDDCAAVSREVGAILDVEDPIESSYVLEVSSPGLDRPLRTPEDFQRFAGRRARIHTFGPVEGRREFHGTLRGEQGEAVLIEDEGLKREVRVPLSQIAKARLEVEV